MITGANKGIGFEAARQLGERGCTVVIGARDAGRGHKAAETLKAEGIDAHAVVLDVTDEKTIAEAARWIDDTFGRLDVLVNNAGILVELPPPPPSAVTVDMMRETYETNTFGPVAVTHAMLPLIRKSPAGRIVNVSSRLSRCSWMMEDDYPISLLAYNSSKAALNAVTLHYARELRDTPIKVNMADPGHASTDITRGAPGPPASDAAPIIVELALIPDDGPTGEFWNTDGPVRI